MVECQMCGALPELCTKCPTRIACAAKMDTDVCQSCPECGGCLPRLNADDKWRVCSVCLDCQEEVSDG